LIIRKTLRDERFTSPALKHLIEVIHTPGHCAGQVALPWRWGRMLFAGDVCMNVMGLGDPVGFESLKQGRASQRKVAISGTPKQSYAGISPNKIPELFYEADRAR
jgi:glyoxylase-like metal-dependent hydrolase (beta-lactamase superfamily II)